MHQHLKIKTLEQLAEILDRHRAEGKRIVLCHGVFDLLHIGHIRYFEQARRMGDVLVVTLTPDEYVDKGPHRPAFTENLRAEAVASMDCVDYVAVNRWPMADETLRLLRPHVYVKGSEFKDISSDPTGKIAHEVKAVEEIGAEMAFTEDIVFSSTSLINRYLSNLPEEIQEYLTVLRRRYRLEDVLAVLEAMAELRVLVIGDTILDEYQYCDAIGKSSKDPVLAVKYRSRDLFAGGVLAVANHVANFAREVQLVTVVGERDSRLEFIKSQLRPNVRLRFAVQEGAPTLVKRRFIDGYSFNKLLEVYVMDDSGLAPEADKELCDWVRPRLGDYDLVIVADFGHGAISDDMVWVLSDYSRFMCLNTQANAGNRGFHTISRYPSTDYGCIAEHELRLETRRTNGRIRPLVEAIGRRMTSRKFVVTRGRRGCAVWDDEGEYVEVPSFGQNVVDRVGAGDAFFSVTSLAAANGAPSELLGFIGNVVGALAVEVVGNQKPIDRQSVAKYITSLMK